MRRAALAALTLALIPTAACGGGGGPDDAEKVAREFTEAVNSGDADKLCEEILSKAAREAVGGGTGDNAEDQCVDELSKGRARPTQVRIRRFVSTKVDGDNATVIAEIEEEQSSRRQVYELVKEDGDFRISKFQ